MIKATAGGGGRGCGWCETIANLSGCFSSPGEAEAAFGNPGLYLEKFIERPAILNFKMGDSYGNVIHLGERDCSIQRRPQSC